MIAVRSQPCDAIASTVGRRLTQPMAAGANQPSVSKGQDGLLKADGRTGRGVGSDGILEKAGGERGRGHGGR